MRRAITIIPPQLARLLSFFALALTSGQALALSVSLTAPAAGAVFAPGSNITVSANATRTNAQRPITKVEFFAGTTLIGTDTTSPYSITWANVPSGTYSLTAKVTDSTGATATSTARSIRVNTLPSVSLTAPANGANFTPGSTIALAATAADSDGTISQVQFFRGGSTLIGSDTTSPYSFNWTNVAAGTYSLTAKATDNNSGVTTSSVVTITVDRAPTVSITAPANNALFTAPANVTVTASAADADGTVSKVDFFDGATLAATVTAAPYSATLANLPPGTHVLTARATDNLGVSTTSAAVTVRVDAAPGVNITAPANNAVFTAPANITLTATASDTDGTVTKVDFFDGATLVGTATAAPYSVTLANAALGSHGFTARATDDLGAVTTSSAINVVVNAAPTVAITSPTSGASFIAPANITLTATAADSDGTVQKVDFFQGGTSLIATATSAPYTVNWSSVAPGSYSVTAVATDNRNATTTSAPVSVTVVANALPAVSITSPASGANFTAPANIAISATALDSDGTIQKVEFFYGGTNLIATLTAPPYSFTWTAVPQGTYSLTAVATDNLNGTRTSAAANVTVGRAPALNFVHVDHLNAPRLIADSTGTPVWRNDNTEAFGDSVPDENPSGLGTFEFPLMVSLYYRDKETGNFYAMQRDAYSPGIGRFPQGDPIGLQGGINVYAYVDNDPLSYTDPHGLQRGGSRTSPNTDTCSYYQKVCSATGCRYYCYIAPMVCKGADYNPMFMWNGPGKLNCVRKCLVEEDQKEQQKRQSTCPGNKCLSDDVIDGYHQRCFTKCQASGYPGVDPSWWPGPKLNPAN